MTFKRWCLGVCGLLIVIFCIDLMIPSQIEEEKKFPPFKMINDRETTVFSKFNIVAIKPIGYLNFAGRIYYEKIEGITIKIEEGNFIIDEGKENSLEIKAKRKKGNIYEITWRAWEGFTLLWEYTHNAILAGENILVIAYHTWWENRIGIFQRSFTYDKLTGRTYRDDKCIYEIDAKKVEKQWKKIEEKKESQKIKLMTKV